MEIIFAERMKQIRLERGMSRRRFAEFLQVSPYRIAAWERGRLPRAYMLFYLSDMLDISADYLVGRLDER